MIIALVGPHGAGKTTLGKRLASGLGVPFHAEIGRQLAAQCAPGRMAQTPQSSFDWRVFRAEMARDQAFVARDRVVETWHPGNLAYAARRSPEVAMAWLPYLRMSTVGERVLVVPVTATREVLASRQTEPGDLDFFWEVGQAATQWASAVGARVARPVVSEGLPVSALAAGLLPGLRRMIRRFGEVGR